MRTPRYWACDVTKRFHLIELDAVCRSQIGCGQATSDLLACFAPLRAWCARHAVQALPHYGRETVDEEVCYHFLELLLAFDASRGVPFAAYIHEMLPRRVQNWVQKERCHEHRETYSHRRNEEQAEDAPDNHAPHVAALSCTNVGDPSLWLWWRQELEELSSLQRRVMEWTLQGETEREIAARLHINPAAVHRAKCRAQKKLQKNW